MAMLLFSVILSTNVLTVWGILTQYNIVAYSSDVQYYIIEGSLIALLSSRFFIKNRYKKVVAKYDDENPIQRKAGIWVLTIYMAITFIGFFIEALYRQGRI